ncbi:MAG: hypothetical protein RO257_11380 [Candidatus Kapabacteria bacterium]|nr:hypothetical protein [Candidatus Kapabacteria bacterium]
MLNDKYNINQYEILNLLYEYQIAKSKINLFSNKYSMDFLNFEKYVNSAQNENFSEWDDYLEWKTYYRIASEKSEFIKELSHESYKLS